MSIHASPRPEALDTLRKQKRYSTLASPALKELVEYWEDFLVEGPDGSIHSNLFNSHPAASTASHPNTTQNMHSITNTPPHP